MVAYIEYLGSIQLHNQKAPALINPVQMFFLVINIKRIPVLHNVYVVKVGNSQGSNPCSTDHICMVCEHIWKNEYVQKYKYKK